MAASDTPTQTTARLAKEFRNPPASCRILRINHGWSTDEAAREAYVASVLEGGFGGVVTNAGFGNGYVTNPANWDALRGGIAAARKAGLDLWLYDEAGYPSGRAGGLVLQDHPEREARALLATSARAEVGADGSFNIGPLARATASSTDAIGGIYAPRNANDGRSDPRDWRHWSNDPTQPPSPERPQWLMLEWDHPWPVQRVVLWTMEGYAAADYAIEYWDGAQWRVFADADVHANTATRREHVAAAPVPTTRLRVLGRQGPTVQPTIVRVVELEVMATPREGDVAPQCVLPTPPGKLLLARAFPESADGGVALDGARDLPPVSDGRITWTVPPGRWQLLAVSEDRLFDGSQVDFSGVPEHAPYVSLLDPAAVSAFVEITHDAYAQRLGNDLGSLFVSTFTDEPSLIADYYARPMPWSPIAWHPVLEGRFAQRTGRPLLAELPWLWLDGPGAARTRYDFWRTVADQLRENYFQRIHTWCQRHGIPSGGHLLLEEDIRHHVPLYGDFFACQRELDVPGIDVLHCDPARTPWDTARLVSSAGDLEGHALVMSETSDFEEMWASPPRPVSLAQFRGTINRLLLGGVNRFNTYSQFRGLAADDLRALNEWTGRASLALTGGVRNATIAVLYPVETAWTRFRPSCHGIAEAGPLSQRLAGTIRQVDQLLYDNRREFSHIDSRTIVEAAAGAGELRFRDLAFQAIILPDTDTLPLAAWDRLERFWEAGGVVIAAGARPLNTDSEFPSPSARACAARLFGQPGRPDASSRTSSPAGGIGVYLPPSRIGDLPAVLDALLEPDVLVSDPAAPLRIARRAIGGRDVLLVINDSAQPWQGTVTFGQPAESAELLDLATGAIMQLPDPTCARLALDGWGATILRLSGASRVPRRG